MFGLGGGEILLILAFALIFIGPKKLPELARNLGKGIREFQKAKDDLLHQVNQPDPPQVDEDENHSKPQTSLTGVDSEKVNDSSAHQDAEQQNDDSDQASVTGQEIKDIEEKKEEQS
jgi:sec-independent protein translocase protein TatA